MKDKTYEKVKKYVAVHGMIDPGDCVAAGVSGGADSVCMLHLLMRLQKEMPFRLLVVHVNHGIRAEAGEDAAFVEGLCRKWELPFFLREVDMAGYARDHGLTGEEAGRILRYRAFASVLEEAEPGGNGKAAVAHNADDRAETMLFHMFRGSGLRGLGSIRPIREAVIRPLLCLDREQIEAYLNDFGLTWRQDGTNEQDVYTRNRIRHHILPYAKREICGKAVSHMGELADILAETEDYLERETDKLYRKHVEEIWPGTDEGPGFGAVTLKIQADGFREEDIVMEKRVLLRAMERLTPYRKDITARHIESLMELMGKDGSKEISLPYGIRAYKEYGFLFLGQSGRESRDGEEKYFGYSGKKTGKETAENPKPEIVVEGAEWQAGVPMEIAVPGMGDFIFVLWETNFLQSVPFFYRKEQNILENGYTKWFDYDKITTSLLLRTRRMGDYLTIDDGLHTQSVKQYMINEKIPKAKRSEMYLLADGSHILWIPGYRTSRQYRVGKSTRRILEVRLRGGDHGGTNRGIVDGGRG